MYAVIRTGGKQYRVQEGDLFTVERLPTQESEKVDFSEVLMVEDGDRVQVGTPLVAEAKVEAEIVGEGKGKKTIVFKKNRRKGYQVKRGHRQLYTRLRVTSITAGS